MRPIYKKSLNEKLIRILGFWECVVPEASGEWRATSGSEGDSAGGEGVINCVTNPNTEAWFAVDRYLGGVSWLLSFKWPAQRRLLLHSLVFITNADTTIEASYIL
ncbi:hypothetical protein E2C01_028678 [Portunus trituberculatus]|uniref:Uncharacterized protein n=1 Tax=Portunus trituberculatus TaxID=210409 RepID=A0A5B7EQ49_PORTR|nr:hypothetical protein [Portunus trituberculatus]